MLRAERLVNYFPNTLGIPAFFFATKESSETNPPFETIKPLGTFLRAIGTTRSSPSHEGMKMRRFVSLFSALTVSSFVTMASAEQQWLTLPPTRHCRINIWSAVFGRGKPQ
jgi:hypothetical protein